MSVEALERWIRAIGEYGYPLLVVSVAFEHLFVVGFLVPGDVIITVGGVLVARGVLAPVGVAIAIAVGIVAGLSASYALGERGGLPLVERWGPRVGVTPARLAAIEGHFERHGAKTVFLAGLLAGVKNVLPAIAGASRMPFGRFLVFGLAGYGARAGLEVALGWVLGKNLDRLAAALGRMNGPLGIAVAVVLVAAVVVVRRLRSGAAARDRVDMPPP